MDEAERFRTAVEAHWRASEDGDSAAEHAMYADAAILDYPQSGESVPTYSVSIMEFDGDAVVHETQYFADAFDAPASRAAIAERMPGH